mmetsp:Transcript_43816/g.171350  ORF Transcript_43816/g.171350 Transcript_43816/m.171350 type:complete len:265 (-) Transcript_43816:1493-2287(-)|eukprot:CAMPEP_0113962422 /NCGR_PEP_ID=MMETSP0011_2-20120614/5905_1 /TAXON_ID=101924 /ORGANISM="Rhodosorus marinus" /LENGTH=264 /DNA_ID=CAMNT_0000974271 /DNA_START=196 /DNA_END=990 /DNA_ORIENTATION=- /assembly_acc=CAM_ASM_000156
MDPELSSSYISRDEQANVEVLKAQIENTIELDDALRTWLTDVTYTRFLRARDQNISKSYKMLSNTIAWRKKKSPEKVVCVACQKNPRSHSLRAIGVCKIGRPVFYSCFQVDNRNVDDNITHCIHLLEKVFELECTLEQNYIWVMDFSGFSAADLNPKFSVKAMKMFQSHYPERMGIAVLFDAPRSFQALWRVLKLVVDENTKKKMLFQNPAAEYPEFDKLFDRELTDRLVLEIKSARETPNREFWLEGPVPPMEDMKIHGSLPS